MLNCFHADLIVSVRSFAFAPRHNVKYFLLSNWVIYIDCDTLLFTKSVGFVLGQGSIRLDKFVPLNLLNWLDISLLSHTTRFSPT